MLFLGWGVGVGHLGYLCISCPWRVSAVLVLLSDSLEHREKVVVEHFPTEGITFCRSHHLEISSREGWRVLPQSCICLSNVQRASSSAKINWFSGPFGSTFMLISHSSGAIIDPDLAFGEHSADSVEFHITWVLLPFSVAIIQRIMHVGSPAPAIFAVVPDSHMPLENPVGRTSFSSAASPLVHLRCTGPI